MTMFGIPAGTKVKLVPNDVSIGGVDVPKDKLRDYTTKSFQVFDVADLHIDPTGISDGQPPTPDSPTGRTAYGALGKLARAGVYGFTLKHVDGCSKFRTLLVHHSQVEVN